MKLKTIVPLFLIFFATQVNSQEYRHGAGVQINAGFVTLNYDSNISGDYTSSEIILIPGLFYRANLGFEVGNMLLSATTYPFIGTNFSFNTQTGGSGFFGVELPLLAELTVGDPDEFCIIGGVGYSAAFLTSSSSGFSSFLGPQADLGGQIPVGKGAIGIKFAFTYGLNKRQLLPEDAIIKTDRKNMFSGSVYYKF